MVKLSFSTTSLHLSFDSNVPTVLNNSPSLAEIYMLLVFFC